MITEILLYYNETCDKETNDKKDIKTIKEALDKTPQEQKSKAKKIAGIYAATKYGPTSINQRIFGITERSNRVGQRQLVW